VDGWPNAAPEPLADRQPADARIAPLHLVTGGLIGANVVVFLLEAVAGDALVATFALWPPGRLFVPELHAVVGFQVWQLATYAFLHASGLHLVLNMLALRIFGRDVEAVLGGRRYLALYAAAVLSAAAVQLAVVSLSRTPYPTIGASGGVFGVLLAFGTLFPERVVIPLIPPIPMRAWFFVSLYATLELVQGVLGTAAGVAHFAHLGGMLGAWWVLRRWSTPAEEAAEW
jgi:membrane associated rhomboid family serine protease